MGRAPCCDKANVKKGPWSPEEDSKLKSYIEKHGTGGNWIALPQKIGLRRCGKSCRLRWLNYLRPNLKHGGFSEEEDNIICNLYTSIGSRWSIIAAQLPGRTDNDIKNYWNTRLKKKLIGKQRKEQQARRASFLKQDVKSETDYFMSVPHQAAVYPYWPELPVPAMSAPNPSQDPHFKDQTSIKNLLLKLGGRFSNDRPQPEQQQQHIITSNFQYPYDQLYQNISTNSIINNNCSQLVDGGGLDSYYQNFNNFATENNDDVFYGNAEQLGGLIMDSLYGFDHQMAMNGSSSSTESSSWGDINSLICAPAPAPAPAPMYSNYEEEDGREGMMLQSYAFDAFQ